MRAVYLIPRGLAAALALLVLLIAVAGCGVEGTAEQPAATTQTPGSTSTTTPALPTTTSSSPEPADMMTLNVYFVRGEVLGVAHRRVLRTEAVAVAAMEQLLSEPTTAEEEWGFTTSIPTETRLLGVTVDEGVATVNLSGEFEQGGGTFAMTMRLAQVVYTLTQFPTVDAVSLAIEGTPIDVFSGEGLLLEKPQTRADYERVTPAILVESVAPGDTVTSPLQLTGTANTFEATFMATITGWDGRIVFEDFVTAASGSGTRGAFDVTLPFEVDEPGLGALIVWEQSAEDGSQINLVEIPLTIER